MATMKDVAAAAGVSVMTVSHVLNGRPRATPATQQRVLAAATELGYEVNLTARSLRSGRTDTIALIVPSFNGYYSELADHLVQVVEAEGRHLVVERTAAIAEAERHALSLARLRTYDGVLLSAVMLGESDILRASETVPLVALGERPMPAAVDHVRLANEDGTSQTTSHVLERGARRVVVLGGSLDPRLAMAEARTRGWQAAHRRFGLEADPSLVVGVRGYAPAAARDVVHGLLSSGVELDAIVGVTDTVATGALTALREAGIGVPAQVQVTGFDDLEIAQHLSPGLTTVNANHAGVARSAHQLLSRAIGGDRTTTEHVEVPVTLVVRGSTR